MPRKCVDDSKQQSLSKVDLPGGSGVRGYISSSSSQTFKKNATDSQPSQVVQGATGTLSSRGSSSSSNILKKSATDSQQSQVEERAATISRIPRKFVNYSKPQSLKKVDVPVGSEVHGSTRSSSKYMRSGCSSSTSKIVKENATDSQQSQVEERASVLSSKKTEGKVYVNNAYNQRHKRVGLPIGSMPISRLKEVYRNNPLNRKLGRVGKPWGTHVVSKSKLAELRKHLEEHGDVKLPKEFAGVSEDDFNHVLEVKQKEEAVIRWHEETACAEWKPHEHTFMKSIARYKGTQIDFDMLEMGPQIGHGSFGVVYFASLKGEAVAVKKLRSQQVPNRVLQQFINEMEVLLHLCHPNIVSLVGACTVTSNLAIIMEFMDMSLYDAIHIKEVDFATAAKLTILTGVINGVDFLHWKKVAHCDMKSQNVLLINVPGELLTDDSKSVLAKITDFGLSKMKSDTTTSRSNPSAHYGTPSYAAPEIHRGEILSLDQLKKADMFSLGLLIWELVEEEIPYKGMRPQQLKDLVGKEGRLPVINLRLEKQVHESLLLCWSMEPDKRPSAVALAEGARKWSSLLDEQEE